eukprot:CAMPEP_0184368986 /NCGR_PEP_ID=MMETSP1089-20130417/161986_1 /TAXON_ID=38269 ORGANISM="Gloeochaete wittrockiana, Strain SAG46.84" /NCGR_SAMPLE_ID=MMETSP1089 /ASSEMBLY_ACC=CAM_ASM_000445 /LENGTH=539 /DNA_ID=CAMNT_0026711369 /DNA_START=193 /DNA_END=1811 /DNA_ORIENTATION=+
MGACCSATPITRTDELGQFIRVDGTAYERGVKLGHFLKDSILWLHDVRDKNGYNFLEAQWLKIARAAKPNIQKYAPITYEEMSGMASVPGLNWDIVLKTAVMYEMAHYNEEMSGMASVPGLNWDIVLKTAVMYEMDMLVTKTVRQPFENIADEFREAITHPYTGRCSAFCWLDGQQLGGQTNDELPALFPIDRRMDVVYVTTGADILPALIYSHPGVPAYFGINSNGLIVMTQTIDDDERDHERGLPTNVMLREALTHYNEEMSGMASVPGLGWDIVLKTAVMYEMDMLVAKTFRQPFENIADEFRAIIHPYTGRCSAFCWLDGLQLGAQTNDELPALFPIDRRMDVLYVTTGADILPALIYSHPGIPAYFGINSNGLIVMTQTIDDDERDHERGLPTNVMLREALTKPSVDAALEYLKSVPKTLSNSVTLMERDRVFSCELFLSKVAVREIVKTGWLAHTNHILYAPDVDDTSRRFAVTKTEDRLVTITEQVKAVYAKGTAALNVESAKQVLSVPPVLNQHTLTKIIFDPVALVAHVW